MRETYKLFDIDLHLFDGAAEGGASGGEAGTAQQTVESTPKAETKRSLGGSRRGKSGEFDNVVFGRQDADTDTNSPVAGENGQGGANKSGVSTTSSSLEDKRKAFRDLIEGEYKDQFDEVFQQSFNRRFKDVKGMETALNTQKPIMDLLMQKYNIADGDIKKLQDAIDKDNAYWEAGAEEAGLTVEQYKAMQKLERENEELKRIQQREAGQHRARQQLSKWYAEGDKLKDTYPNFDLQAECENRDFLGLLRSGLSVKNAYELVHMDEIKASAAKAAAEATGAQMAARIQSKASRPTENGLSTQSAAIVKNDVHSLTRAERAEIARRVQRGEKIRF